MNQITHKEARRLIQHNADQVLDRGSLSLLNAHLEECMECSTYAGDLNILENVLQGAMRRKWNLSTAPLSIHTITNRGQSKTTGFANNAMVTRTAALALAILVMLFGTWQFSRSSNSLSSQMLTFALPIPTPSAQLTSTSDKFQGCDFILYQVQKNDTMESLVLQYGVSKYNIMRLNSMKTETLHPPMQVKIPLCNSTPTGTINPPTHTITPQFELHSSTPG